MSRYCHKCGKKQIDEDAAEAHARGYREGLERGELVADSTFKACAAFGEIEGARVAKEILLRIRAEAAPTTKGTPEC